MAQIVASNLQSNNGQPIIIQVVGNGNNGSNNTGSTRNGSKQYKGLAAILGFLHIIFGVLSGVFSAIAQSYDNGSATWHFILWGYWTPVLWFIAGGFGLGTACVRNNCMIITFMTMSIISACSIIWYLTFAGLELAISVENEEYDDRYTFYYEDFDYSKKVRLDGVVVAVGVCEGLVSIFSAILCCSGVCCGASKTTVNTHTIEQIRQIINQAETSQGAQTLQGKGHDNVELQVEPRTAPSYDNDNPPPYQDARKDSSSRL